MKFFLCFNNVTKLLTKLTFIIYCYFNKYACGLLFIKETVMTIQVNLIHYKLFSNIDLINVLKSNKQFLNLSNYNFSILHTNIFY